MNQVKIKDLYAGKPDAKDEINYDGLEGFINTFVIPDSICIEDLIEKDKFYITGYKGTGKTALLFFLDDYIKQNDPLTCSSFIFFKESFNDYRKNEFEKLSKRIMNSISIQEDTLIEVTDFEYIWRWLFFKRIVDDNTRNNNQLFEENEAWSNFKSIIDKIKDPLDNKKVVIPSAIKINFPIRNLIDMTEIGAEFEVDLSKPKGDGTYQKFRLLIDAAEGALACLTRTDIPYYIFVDELEAYYGDSKVFSRDLYLIRDLIFTIKRFNDILMKFDHTKIICSIRSEVINAITRFIVPREINKIITGFEVPLLWNYNNSISYVHPIMQILIKRIGICEANNMNDKEIYNRWFPEVIQGIEPSNYILNNSWFKPRDVVRLLLAAQNSIEKERSEFNQAVFSACLKRYSADSLEEIREEMLALYSASEIQSIISCFTGFKAKFSCEELKKRIEQNYSDTILNNRFNEVISDLYRLGFLGNYLPASDTYRWQHKGDDEVILGEDWRLMIHFALRPVLSVSSKQDYGLSKYIPPQVGDVVVAEVKKVYPIIAITEFEHMGRRYCGTVHISEINGGVFIDSVDCVTRAGDTFKAVVLGYDSIHKKWKLSKNKFTGTPIEVV